MQKILNRISVLWLLAMVLVSCHEDRVSLNPITVPSNLEVSVEIVGADEENPYGDGSGTVHFSANADNALSYQFIYNGEVKSSPGGNTTFNFSKTGLFTYNVTVAAIGSGGVPASKPVPVEVLVTYEPPADLLQMLVGDGERTWRIKSEAAGHFGLGPVGGSIPTEWYGAAPEEKADRGMYDDRYTFKADGTFTHITNGTVFGRGGLIDELGGSGGEEEGADIINYSFDDYEATWSLSAPNDQETISLSGIAFIGYYTGGDHRYQIFSRNPDEMVIRTTDGNNEFDWWFTLIAVDAGSGGNGGDETAFTELIWAEEFDTDGAPDSASWNYALGDGCPDLCGWGNNEEQWYTDASSNIAVENGVLRITALKETIETKEYSSARINTKGKFEFTYGKVEVRAKLPGGGGTWPAIWMLGADIDSNPWPGAGEIDIMEHVGNDLNVISGTTHDPNNFGGNAQTGSTTIENADTEFHTYSIEWTSESIEFFVDGNSYHTVSNDQSLPFNKDFYLLLNVAMGGNLGGTIDPGFDSSSMEIDYIRVYQ